MPYGKGLSHECTEMITKIKRYQMILQNTHVPITVHHLFFGKKKRPPLKQFQTITFSGSFTVGIVSYHVVVLGLLTFPGWLGKTKCAFIRPYHIIPLFRYPIFIFIGKCKPLLPYNLVQKWFSGSGAVGQVKVLLKPMLNHTNS